MRDAVFDDIVRFNAKPARYDEGSFEFLNRTASLFFSRCRDLTPTLHGAW